MSSSKYIPQAGDLFAWCDEEYWCLSSDSHSGTVAHVGETSYKMHFVWDFEGVPQVFIRKATEKELESIGLTPPKN